MADMPEVICAGIVEDDYGRSEQVWEEDEGCLANHGDILEAKPYLRADTCTPNERLDGLIREIKSDIKWHRERAYVNTPVIHNAQAEHLESLIEKLREVMK